MIKQGRRFDEIVFPALCAHRGVPALMPESCIPGFAAGIALGADEIEFDIRLTKDKKLVVSHDNKVDRVANGTGKISELNLNELQALKLLTPGEGAKWDVTFSTPEDIFAAIGTAAVMNLHFKDFGEDTEVAVAEMKRLVYQYSLTESVYFSTSNEGMMKQFLLAAPEIPRCALEPFDEDLHIVDYAVKYGCPRCQLHRGFFDAEKVRMAVDAGVVCNVFWSDDEETAREYLDMGNSVLLTNRTDLLRSVIKEYRG